MGPGLRARALVILASLALLLAACGGEVEPRFASPALTFATYRDALARDDAAAAWACLSPTYRRQVYDDDRQAWQEQAAGRRRSRQVSRLEIVDEREINERIAFLEFDPRTVAPRTSTFYYFLNQGAGWRITTHLDSVFRAELQAAIERGEFRLPARVL